MQGRGAAALSLARFGSAVASALRTHPGALGHTPSASLQRPRHVPVLTANTPADSRTPPAGKRV